MKLSSQRIISSPRFVRPVFANLSSWPWPRSRLAGSVYLCVSLLLLPHVSLSPLLRVPLIYIAACACHRARVIRTEFRSQLGAAGLINHRRRPDSRRVDACLLPRPPVARDKLFRGCAPSKTLGGGLHEKYENSSLQSAYPIIHLGQATVQGKPGT